MKHVARWLAIKFAKKNFQSIYVLHIRFAYTFCIYILYIQLASIVEDTEVVQVGCGALWAVQAACD